MTGIKQMTCAGALVALLVLLAGTAHCRSGDGDEAVVNMDRGSLGIMLAGGAGSLEDDPGGRGRYYVFEEPPRVLRVYRGGPSDGKLEADDLILAVGGHGVASQEGSLLLMRPDRGAELVLKVKRDGEELDVAVTVGRYDRSRSDDFTFDMVHRDEDGRMRAATRTDSRVRSSSRFISRSRAGNRGSTRSWYGVGLETRAVVVKDDDSEWSVIYFEDPPRVYSVDPDGPAGMAGIRRGDVLVMVDGEALDEDAGAELFSSAAPGDTVHLLIQRDGEDQVIPITPGDYPLRVVRRGPDSHVAVAGGVHVGPEHLRFAGTVGDVDVEVRGGGEVSVSRTPTEIVIDTGSATVRLNLREDVE